MQKMFLGIFLVKIFYKRAKDLNFHIAVRSKWSSKSKGRAEELMFSFYSPDSKSQLLINTMDT